MYIGECTKAGSQYDAGYRVALALRRATLALHWHVHKMHACDHAIVALPIVAPSHTSKSTMDDDNEPESVLLLRDINIKVNTTISYKKCTCLTLSVTLDTSECQV